MSSSSSDHKEHDWAVVDDDHHSGQNGDVIPNGLPQGRRASSLTTTETWPDHSTTHSSIGQFPTAVEHHRHLSMNSDHSKDGRPGPRQLEKIPTVKEEYGHAANAPTDRQNFNPVKTRIKSPQELERHNTLSTIRSHLGLDEVMPIVEGHEVHHHLCWSGIRAVMREPFAEFWGVVIMILFGDGSVAQVLLSTGNKGIAGGNGAGAYQSISWAWGLGVMLGIYVAGDSGAYLNPAVTFAFNLYRGLPWKRFPIYFVAQVLGAFVGSGIVYANYLNAINQYEGHGIRTVPGYSTHATAGIFCTYPAAFMTKAGQFFSEFIASTILIFVIFALKDESNTGAMGKSGAGKFFPLALFFLIFGLGACFGWETGYAINLARDFGPRLMSYVVGYGPNVWRAGGYYFWIPMVAPFCGCTFGGFLYDLFIYTGPDSPINTPWIGFKKLLTGAWLPSRRRKEVVGDEKMV